MKTSLPTFHVAARLSIIAIMPQASGSGKLN
jgi:hypothetical protein